MFLSDRDLEWAIARGHLIVESTSRKPRAIGPTSIDLHLDRVEEAKVWDIAKFKEQNRKLGHGDFPELPIGTFDYKAFAGEFQKSPPTVLGSEDTADLVFRRGHEIIVRPGGFVLWQTKERVGTPEEGAQLICFVDGKSTKARTGIVIHMTAPTIHAAWGAWPVTLEIANLGPFHFVLKEDDAIAQITVATISSVPAKTMKQAGSVTVGQKGVGLQDA
jgi:deoxycytidine triphosphate deaminase